MEPIKAGTNPATIKPGVIVPAIQIVMAFMTNKNSPKVINEIGNVKMTKIGLTNALTNPKTTAAIRAATRFLTTNPGTSWAESLMTPP